MARNNSNDETVDMAVLGAEGDTCTSCGEALATDQRYCLNCGTARTEPRLDFTQHLGGPKGKAEAPAAAAAPAPAVAGAAGAVPPNQGFGQQWTPLWAIGAIAVLGAMLLLGVLIGKDNDNQTVAAAPVTTTTAEATDTTATDTTADATAAKDKGAGAKAAGGGGGKTASGGIQGGSGSTEGISTDNPLEGLTGAELQEAQKNSPDVVATEGEALPTDNKPAGGGSGGGACIGC